MPILLAIAALVATGAAAGVVYQVLGAHRDTGRHPAPGRLIEIECGRLLKARTPGNERRVRLHLHEQGAGTPVVVLESGIAATSLSWALVQPKIAEFTRVVSYDRAGLGWSAECDTPRNVEQMVSELSALLARAALPPPYILVGHSFGGLLIRAYAALQPADVCALLFLDPVSLEYWAQCDAPELRRLERAVRLSRRGAWLARFGIVRLALAVLAAGGRSFPKLIARASAGKGAKIMEHLAGEIRRLPPSVWPLVRAHWSRPKCFEAMALYLECLPASASGALRLPIPAEVPFLILSASNATAAELAERDSWVAQRQHGRHMRLEQCGHWLQLEQPDVVVEAIRALIDVHSQAHNGTNSLSARQKQKPLDSL